MRKIERSSAFKRDYKREAKGRYRTHLDTDFVQIITALANDRPLAIKCRDHELSSNWGGCRECHIRPDLLLIYRKPDDGTLELIRLGSHSELFG